MRAGAARIPRLAALNVRTGTINVMDPHRDDRVVVLAKALQRSLVAV